MYDLKLPDAFEKYSEERKAGFLKIKADKESGKHFAGYFCTFTPLEILDAAGVMAVSLCGMSEETIPEAELSLPKNLCPLIKSSYGFYVSDKCPYTYWADLIVGETTCDGKKKMYELMGQGKETYILQIPQGTELPYAKKLWISELRHFISFIEKRFDVTITDEMLRAASQKRNELRRARCRLMEVLSRAGLVLSGRELYTYLEGLSYNYHIDDAIAATDELAGRLEALAATDSNAKRILITGCPIGGVYKKVVRAVESNGGQVVCFENCSGIKAARSFVDTSAPDIIDALADAYLSIGCAVMSPNIRRFENLPALVREFKADGVLDVALQACQSYIIEGRSLRELCMENEIPYMALETDYSTQDAGQIDTRITAFLEAL